MAGLGRTVTIANLAPKGVAMYHSPQVPQIKSVTVRNASTIAIPVYLEASSATSTPDFIVGPKEYATMPCDCKEIFFGYLALADPPAGMAYFFISDEALAASSGELSITIGDVGGKPIATAQGNRLAWGRVNFLNAGVPAPLEILTPNFAPRSARLWGIAGGAYLFVDRNVPLPIVLDANGVPSDISYCGQVARGGDVVLHLIEGSTEAVLVPLGSAGELYRRTLGANHLWKLNGLTPTDTIGNQNGTFRVALFLTGQAAIFPDADFSALAQGNPGGADAVPAMVDTHLAEPNAGGDFSLEFQYKPASILGGQTQTMVSSKNLAQTTGWHFQQSGGGTIVLNFLGPAPFGIAPPNLLTVGTAYHVVIVVGVAAKQYALYLNGASIGTVSGTAYVPSTGTVQIGGDAGQHNAPGNYENVATYPFALTPQQVTGLYAESQAPTPPELFVALTDELWPPFSGKVS